MAMLNNQIVNHFPFRSFGISPVKSVLFRVFVEKSLWKVAAGLRFTWSSSTRGLGGFTRPTRGGPSGMTMAWALIPLGIHWVQWGTLFSDRSWLVGGLEHEFYLIFPIYWECHHPNWLIFFRGVGIPPTSWCWPGFWQDPHGPVSRTWLLPWVLIPRWLWRSVQWRAPQR